MSYNPHQLHPIERDPCPTIEDSCFCEICDMEVFGDDVVWVNRHHLCDDYQCMKELAWMVDNELHEVRARIDAMVKKLSTGM